MTAPPIPCRWCGRACQARRGGSSRLFCTSGCRTAFHSAARRWAERAVASGLLTLADLRNSNPAACTLAGGGKSPARVPEGGKAIELLDDILHELLLNASPNALDALSRDILDRIVAYLDEPEP